MYLCFTVVCRGVVEFETETISLARRLRHHTTVSSPGHAFKSCHVGSRAGTASCRPQFSLRCCCTPKRHSSQNTRPKSKSIRRSGRPILPVKKQRPYKLFRCIQLRNNHICPDNRAKDTLERWHLHSARNTTYRPSFSGVQANRSSPSLQWPPTISWSVTKHNHSQVERTLRGILQHTAILRLAEQCFLRRHRETTARVPTS